MAIELTLSIRWNEPLQAYKVSIVASCGYNTDLSCLRGGLVGNIPLPDGSEWSVTKATTDIHNRRWILLETEEKQFHHLQKWEEEVLPLLATLLKHRIDANKLRHEKGDKTVTIEIE